MTTDEFKKYCKENKTNKILKGLNDPNVDLISNNGEVILNAIYNSIFNHNLKVFETIINDERFYDYFDDTILKVIASFEHFDMLEIMLKYYKEDLAKTENIIWAIKNKQVGFVKLFLNIKVIHF